MEAAENKENMPVEDTPGLLSWFKGTKGGILFGSLCIAVIITVVVWVRSDDDEKKSKKVETARSDSTSVDDFVLEKGEIHIVGRDKNGTLVEIILVDPKDGSNVYNIIKLKAYLSIPGETLLQEKSLLDARGIETVSSSHTIKTITPEPNGYDNIASTPRKEFFSKKLQRKRNHPDNKRLQKVLNQLGYIIAESGPGSPGKETEEFGPATERALKMFKSSNKFQMEDFGAADPSGAVLDDVTRDFLNHLITENEADFQTAFAD